MTTQTRTYNFEARVPDLAVMQSMPGLDYLRGILRGDFPAAPISATLDFYLVEVDHGRAVFEGTPSPFIYNPLGMVHGGWAATILQLAEAWIYERTRKKAIPHRKLGKHIRFTDSDLSAIVQMGFRGPNEETDFEEQLNA